MSTIRDNLNNLTVIFDNGGGITINALYADGDDGDFYHYYKDPAQAAYDVKALLDGDTTAGWDGHDDDALINPTYEQISNGGYMVFDGKDIASQITVGTIDASWHNVDEFFRAIGCAIGCAVNV